MVMVTVMVVVGWNCGRALTAMREKKNFQDGRKWIVRDVNKQRRGAGQKYALDHAHIELRAVNELGYLRLFNWHPLS